MSEDTFSLRLNDNMIILAFQLLAFYEIRHKYTKAITNNCHNILQFIIKKYINSSISQTPLTEESADQRERSAGLDTSADFQPAWCLKDSRSKIRKTQTDLLTFTTSLHDHFYYLNWLESQSKAHLQSLKSISTKSFDVNDMSDNNNDQPPVLTEKEKKQQMISRITAAVIAAVQAANLTDSCSDSSASMPAAASPPAFKIEEIGHFHSDLNKSYDEEDVVFSEKNTLIQDVHLFCDQIQNVTELQEDNIIKINLPVCL